MALRAELVKVGGKSAADFQSALRRLAAPEYLPPKWAALQGNQER
jgi:hypothetical protein